MRPVGTLRLRSWLRPSAPWLRLLWLRPSLLAILFLPILTTLARADEPQAPVAGVFLYPIGDEMDFKKPALGEPTGFHISDPYLAVRAARGRRPRRVHYGVDLSSGRAGNTVRAIATGVVEVSDGNALVKIRKAHRVRVRVIVKGKRVHRWRTRYGTSYRWRTGWGNRVVIRHMLPSGQIVYSLYAHLMPRSVLVKKGELVAAGQPIAKVGRTGRATAAHLHLEIRTTRVDEEAEITDPDDDDSDTEEEGLQTAVPHTVDPLAFLGTRVVHFRDLEPGTWQSRYALAAMRDGIILGSKGRFDPDGSISREDFYGALVTAFQLGGPEENDFDEYLESLADAGILDASQRASQKGGDRLTRSDALELVLRCLDRRAARGECLARIGSEQLARDFNRQFAGSHAAAQAELEARRTASAETASLRRQAAARSSRAAKEARTHGKRARVRPSKVTPVQPVPILDPGFESLAQSKKDLSRAEACLLLASALRIRSSKVSALERAAARVANSG